MKTLLTAVALTLTLVSAQAFAQETAPKEMAAQATEAPATCDGGECPMSKAMAALPKMTYRVGTEDTCCSESAAALAKESSAPIHFVVAEKVYEDKTEAMTALVEQTEEMVTEFITPCTCEASGAMTVAGETCNCPMQGAKNTELVKKAVEAVDVSYKVGEETCSCPMKAKELAAESHGEVHYIVDGEETTCGLTARLNTARAKYKAAVEAMTAASPKEAEAGTNS